MRYMAKWYHRDYDYTQHDNHTYDYQSFVERWADYLADRRADYQKFDDEQAAPAVVTEPPVVVAPSPSEDDVVLTPDASTQDVSQLQPSQPQTDTTDASANDASQLQPSQPQTETVDTSANDVSQPQPAQPQTETVDASANDVSQPQPAQTTGQSAGLTHSTTAVHSAYDGQIIENLDLYVDQGDAITITHDNVILRNVRVHHADGNGVVVSGANNVTIENSEVINSSPPSGMDPETSEFINIQVEQSPNLTVHNVTVREGSSGIYLVESPGADISHVDGYNFHGPFPRGQFVQFDKSGDSSLTDFYAYNDAGSSHPEDIVSVYASPNTTISSGVIDGNNSVTGVAVMFENGSVGGRVDHVDAIHQGNGAFSSYASDVTFDNTRSFDNIFADQGRGPSASDALIWNVSSPGVSILNSTYTDPGNPGNVVWDASRAVVADIHEDPNLTPMAHITNSFVWNGLG